jgi:hypothetical protein
MTGTVKVYTFHEILQCCGSEVIGMSETCRAYGRDGSSYNICFGKV